MEGLSGQPARQGRVRRVSCRPRGGGFVQSKLAGTRQLWHVLTNNVPTRWNTGSLDAARARNVPGLPLGRRNQGDILKIVREYSDDETNTETVTTLQLHVGGGTPASGIHWHIA